jgi:uncharacterized membrane protein
LELGIRGREYKPRGFYAFQVLSEAFIVTFFIAAIRASGPFTLEIGPVKVMAYLMQTLSPELVAVASFALLALFIYLVLSSSW